MTTLLIAGATGLVGREVLAQSLADARVTRVIAPTRRALEPHPKLDNPIVDFESLPGFVADAAVCTLGTTRKQAGSDAAFRKVDFDYVLAIAKAAREGGAKAFVLTSSVGANAGSSFLYMRTKGEIEAAIAALGFASYTVVRPAGLVGERANKRLGEQIGNGLARGLSLIMPRRYRPVKAAAVATTLLQAALAAAPGQHLVQSEAIA